MNNNYNADSIETLNFVDAVRKRIEMYMGSADNQGVLQCIREVISNSIDEYSIGYGRWSKSRWKLLRCTNFS